MLKCIHMIQRLYQYYPEDFSLPDVRVLHMDLDFDVFDTFTRVRSVIYLESLVPDLIHLSLNAKNIEMESVNSPSCSVKYVYDIEKSLLNIEFNRTFKKGDRFSIETCSVCRPTHNVLEGLYYDDTPQGAPPQQITQCQQWGFQRIVPCIDDMTAKCTYRTTIRADARYTNMITNGDIAIERHRLFDDLGNDTGRDCIVYENMKTPMAPYLFFLGVGTYETFTKQFEYPDGSSFDLELLVLPGSSKKEAEQALSILFDSIMWVYLFTGPESYKDTDTRRHIFELTKLREHLKYNLSSSFSGPQDLDRIMRNLASVRSKIEILNRGIVPGYKYTGTVYREIGMQNSDFGGMENVGNTTITMNRIMPYVSMTDASFEYMADVKVHEYYHNLNGSEVTGISPFEIWLNEAVTVCVEQDFHAYFFGDDYTKVKEFVGLHTPVSGTLALDKSASSMPVIPPGFNDPNDLITSVTYVKAPKIVRMIESLVGKEHFVRALDNYHRKYAHSNASTNNWLFEMSSISGFDIESVTKEWLYETGYPIVSVAKFYNADNKVMRLRIRQSPSVSDGSKPPKVWKFPFSYSFSDRKGNILYKKTLLIEDPVTDIVIPNLERPSFASFDTNGVLYGRLVTGSNKKELYLQVRKDSDIIPRFQAFLEITKYEFEALLRGEVEAPSLEYCSLYHELLCNQSLMQNTGALFLTVFESSDDPIFSCQYKKLYETRQKIYKTIASTYKQSLLILYSDYADLVGSENDDALYTKRTSLSYRSLKIRRRMVKNHVMFLLSSLDTPEVWDIIRNQIHSSDSATDSKAAFFAWLHCSAPDKSELIQEIMTRSKKDPVQWESFLSAVSTSYSSDTLPLIRMIESDPTFRIEQSNDQRALYGGFARNRKLSLQTSEGLEFLSDRIIKLSEVNEYNTVGLLNAFSSIDCMERADRLSLFHSLVHIYERIDAKKAPSVSNRIKKLMLGAPKAFSEYELSTRSDLSSVLSYSFE